MHFISKAIHFASPNKHLQVQWQCVLKSVIFYEVGLMKNKTPLSHQTFGVQDCVSNISQCQREHRVSPDLWCPLPLMCISVLVTNSAAVLKIHDNTAIHQSMQPH